MFSQRTNWKLTPNLFTQAHAAARADGAEILDLTVSNPTQADFPYDAKRILSALSSPEALAYDPQPKGILAAREAVAEYYRSEHNVFELDPESIILTASTSEAYSYVFRLLCNPDDEVLVPKPSYPLFEFLADLQDVKLVSYPLIYDHGWQVDFTSLYKAVTHRTRAVVLVHPNNPTGSYVAAEEIRSLNAFCREYGLALVVDEVFLDYSHDGIARSTFAANDQVLTFTTSGLSKISGLPQMKIAWLITSGPEEAKREALSRLEVIADTYLSVSTPLQLAVQRLLEERRNIQPLLLDRTRANLLELDQQLSHHKACSRLGVEGGWYATVRVPVTQSDEELAIEIMREKSVLVHPGHFYDFTSDGYLVLSLITPAHHFREGIRRIFELIDRQ